MLVRSSPRLCAHLAAAAGAFLIASAVDVASAQTPQRDDRGGITGSISGGVGVAPDFEGSSDYDLVPFIFGDINALGVRLEIQGLGARLNFRPDRPFQFGPVFSYRPGREDVSNDVVDRLEDIDDSFEAGGFVSYEFTELFGSADSFALSAEVLADLGSGHEGWTASFGAGYGTSLGDRWRAGVDAGVTWASDDYMQTYFGVDRANSVRSGLPVFDAEAGIKDVGVGATLTYVLSERWSVSGRASYTRLLGDAADSPIVEQEGSPDQFFGGLGLTFRY